MRTPHPLRRKRDKKMWLLTADQDLSIPKPNLGKPLAMKILKQLTMADSDTTDIKWSSLTFPHITHQGDIEKDMILMVAVTVI